MNALFSVTFILFLFKTELPVVLDERSSSRSTSSL